MGKLQLVALLLPFALLSACSREHEAVGQGCGVSGASPLCGKTCTSDVDCGAGTYCGPDGTCTADCLSGGDQCAPGTLCDPTGRCASGASDLGTGNPFDRDGACAVLSSQATLEKSPVDVILVVDNSGSMTAEIVAVQDNINTNFADIIAMSGLDYRVIVLSNHGDAADDQSICITAPLSGNATCSPPAATPTNTANFFHYSVEIGSHNSLLRIIETYDVPDEHDLAPMGWSQWLRPEAHKTFIEITDDEETNLTFQEFDDQLLALQPSNFGTAQARRYTFHAITGLKENSPVTTPWSPMDPLQTELCTPPNNENDPPDVGTNYQELARLTGGLRYPICQYASFDAVFQAVAQGVVASGEVACDFAVPSPPGGGTIDLAQVAVAYTPGAGGAVQYFKQAATSGACVDDAFYVEAGRIYLCPNTCAELKADPAAKVEVLFVCESTIL